MKAFSYFLALNSCQFFGFRVDLIHLLQGEECLEVDNWHIGHFVADYFSAFANSGLNLLVDGLFDLD